MKTKKQKTEKSTIELLREIRDNISNETQNMTLEQLQKYIEEQLKETLHQKAIWRKKLV
jgi:hypothetical protein